jgi:hypothetical protein
LLPTSSFNSNDNVVTPAGPFLDGSGVSFGNTGTGYGVNLSFNGDIYELADSNSNRDFGGMKLAAVPELSSMLGFGSFVALGGLVLLRRRRQALNAV